MGDSLLSNEPAAEPQVDPTNETPNAEPAADLISSLSFGEDVDWAKTALDPDIASDPSMKAIKNLENLAKSYVHSQRMMGKDKVIIPNFDTATKEEIDQFYGKLGYPMELGEYDLKVREGADYPEEFLNNVKELMFNNKVSSKAAGEILNYFEDMGKKMEDQRNTAAQEAVQQGIEQLKQEWGQAFDQKVQLAKLVSDKFVDDKEFQYMEEAGLTNDPTLVKVFARIGETLGEKQIRGEGTNQIAITPVEAHEEYNNIMSNIDGPYFNAAHPDHNRVKERVSQLIRMI